MAWFTQANKEEQKLQWQLGPSCDADLASTNAEELVGRVRVEDGGSCYITLGVPPISYASISSENGIPVSTEEMHILELEAEADEDVQHSLLVLEYDAAGKRTGTVRWRRRGPLLYRPGADVARIVIALRTNGDGELRIEKLSWQRQREVFSRGLAKLKHQPDLELPASNGRPIFLSLRQPSEPFTIWPTGSIRIATFGMKPGRYTVDLVHSDPTLAKHSDALTAHFEFDEPLDERIEERVLGYDRLGSDLRSSLPVVSRGRGRYRNAVHFTVVDEQDWAVLEIGSSLDRWINVDRASITNFVPAAVITPEESFAYRVNEFVAELENPERTNSVVYADINVNAVDGSSVWLSSVLSMLTAKGRCILVSRLNVESDIVLSNVRNRDRLTVVGPGAVRNRGAFSIREAVAVIRCLDDRLPALRNVIVRGCAVAEELFATRQLRDRGFAYLTDFYEVGEDGIDYPEEKLSAVRIAATHAAKLLVQNREVSNALVELAGREVDTFLLPPSIPPIRLTKPKDRKRDEGPIRIGYAGKINPLWGILELLDWTETMRAEGLDVELTIVSNKFSNKSGGVHIHGLRGEIMERLEALDATFHDGLNRRESMATMNKMDFVWCWRPATLEENTLELSTKLIEMVAQGARCICYPNAINRNVLGDDYAFYAKDYEDVAQIVATFMPRPVERAKLVKDTYSQKTIGKRLVSEGINTPKDRSKPRLLVSGHGLKFVEPYVSHLKASGHHVKVDRWDWGRPADLERTEADAEWADTIFCEWGLANAVWHSQNVRYDQRLFVRCHAQEIRDKARRFASRIDADKVEKFIFVSDRIRCRAMELYGWPEEKTVLVPNFLLDDEYIFSPPSKTDTVRLGLVGMVPQSKRFDRALDVLAELGRRKVDAELHIKGHRPDELDFMHAPGRAEELKHFLIEYHRLKTDPLIKDKVIFDGWGNDVAQWYGTVDHILSPSDHESFHYALADGVLAGCQPLVWPWEDADQVYPPDWVVSDADDAASRIIAFRNLDQDERIAQLQSNRAEMVERYGHDKIFAHLNEILGLA
ncbi:hypothetical protein [Sphingomicrobium clamense]|uniref:Glycosyltransferase n=1 Tax=Sphingomicrobium clamense TaxID=2851013 RepID=A0ABS6V284_9SPHN|nr:hypothetical protein [Sphingomicrobium sp. B8]MBW0143686.1 hypothetical protein [Sphingomicrobium sp. B8]